MNLWQLRTPRQWWRGHHWSFTYQPYVPTSDRVCKRCGKHQRLRMVDLPDQLWAWETLRQGDEAKVCNDVKSKTEVWMKATTDSLLQPERTNDKWSSLHRINGPVSPAQTECNVHQDFANALWNNHFALPYCPKCGAKL